MPSSGQIPFSNNRGDFAPALVQNKHAARAHDALRDLMRFHQALQAEMASLGAAAEADARLLEMMAAVNVKYQCAMQGLETSSDEAERHALTSLADAIKDMMFYIYNKRGGH